MLPCIQIIKDLWLKTDIYGWNRTLYQQYDGGVDRLDGALDLNAGLEFKVSRSLNLWAQFNNLTNKSYERWNQYPVYGFNFVGGVVFSFDQKH